MVRKSEVHKEVYCPEAKGIQSRCQCSLCAQEELTEHPQCAGTAPGKETAQSLHFLGLLVANNKLRPPSLRSANTMGKALQARLAERDSAAGKGLLCRVG